MNIRNKKIGAILFGLCMVMIFGAGAVTGDSTDVVVTWIVPGDTSFSLTFAGIETEIVFDCGDRNFTGVGARSQTTETPILNITNNGNTAIDIHMVFNASFATGVQYVNCSVNTPDNTTLFWWEGPAGSDNASSSNQTVSPSIAIGDGEDFWFYSTGVEVEETAEGEDTLSLKVTSVNV